MPPTTPEQRFEVPPEYAEVYERAYRRAYEEGQGQLSSEVVDPVRRARGRRGSRLSRTSHRALAQARAPQWAQQWPGQESDPDEARDEPPTGDPSASAVEPVETREPGDLAIEVFSTPFADDPPVVEPTETRRPEARREAVPPVVVDPDEPGQSMSDRQGRRAKRRSRTSSVAWVLGVLLLALLLAASSFALGRMSVGRVDVPGLPAAAAPAARAPAPAAQSPVSARAIETGLAGLQSAMEPPGRYRGGVARLSGLRARATCTAPADRDGAGHRVSYAPRNVLDGVPATAWLCKGARVGSRLTITLPTTTDVVRIGLVPGYAKLDRYAKNNRITRVAWLFDDGTRVVQRMDGSKKNDSLRTLRIDPVRTRTVVVQILGLARGAMNNTAVSAVRLDTYRH